MLGLHLRFMPQEDVGEVMTGLYDPLYLQYASTGTNAWGEPCCFCKYQDGRGIVESSWLCCKHGYCWTCVGNKHGRVEWRLPLRREGS